jgi:hypothetical protein
MSAGRAKHGGRPQLLEILFNATIGLSDTIDPAFESIIETARQL